MIGHAGRLALCAGALALSALLAGGCSPQGEPSDASAPGSAGGAETAAQAQADAAPSNDKVNIKSADWDCGGNLGPKSSYAARPKSLRYCLS